MIVTSNLKPVAIEIKSFIDNRGLFMPVLDGDGSMEIRDLDSKTILSTIKRSYFVRNFSKSVVRAWHYHSREWKVMLAIKNSFQIMAVKAVQVGNQLVADKVYSFVSSDKRPLLICIPPNFYNGNMSLEDDSILVVYSNSTTDESMKDDTRLPANYWDGLWTVCSR